MHDSETTLYDAIRYIEGFCPVKIVFNGIVLYNDYDSDVEIEEGVYGEIAPPLVVVPNRICNFKNSIVTSVNIEIVSSHHSIVTMWGEYKENN